MSTSIVIKNSERIECVRFFHSYSFKDNKNSGFSFPCDEMGNLLPLQSAGLENWNRCQNSADIIDEGIVKEEWSYFQPAIGKCDCGKLITLDGDSMGECECDCGRVYNNFGQRLVGKTHPWNGQNEDGEYYYEEDAY
jgi:hypothetical protein